LDLESQLIIQDAKTGEEDEANRRAEFKVTEYNREIAKQIRNQEEALFKKNNVEVEIIGEKTVPQPAEDEFDFI
jgi:hypothetical protein